MIENIYRKARFNDAVLFASLLHVLADDTNISDFAACNLGEGPEGVSVPKQYFRDVVHVVIRVILGGYHGTLICVNLYTANVAVLFMIRCVTKTILIDWKFVGPESCMVCLRSGMDATWGVNKPRLLSRVKPNSSNKTALAVVRKFC